MSRPVIAVVAFDQISPFHLSVPCLVLGEPHPGLPPIECLVVAAEPLPLRTSAGFSMVDLQPLAALERADTIIVPSWRDPLERPPAPLLAALQAAQARGAQLVGLCLGAFVLAYAGLLDGRRATTHWAAAPLLAERFSAVHVNPQVLYVQDGALLTSAGTAAALDCCLHLVRSRWGVRVANRVARRLVMPPHREGGQAQYMEQPLPTTLRTAKLATLMEHVRSQLHAPHSLDSLAAQAHMGRRTLSRQFKQHTGMTVLQWLVRERLAYSQQLLESTDQSVERVAELAGFGSALSLREHFRAAFGVSPSAWKKTFAAPAAGLSSTLQPAPD